MTAHIVVWHCPADGKEKSCSAARKGIIKPRFPGHIGDARSRSPSVLGVFHDFCRITACCFANQTREAEYFETIKAYEREQLDKLALAMSLLINEMESQPFADVLGTYYTEINSSATQSQRGEYYTPPPISKLMALVSMDTEEIKAKGQPVSISDPCCGSGGMILAAAEAMVPQVDLMRVTLQDRNPAACDMAFINTTLWGIPAEIIMGNTLALGTKSRWVNVHWVRVGEDERQRGLNLVSLLREMCKTDGAAYDDLPPKPSPLPPLGEQLGLF